MVSGAIIIINTIYIEYQADSSVRARWIPLQYIARACMELLSNVCHIPVDACYIQRYAHFVQGGRRGGGGMGRELWRRVNKSFVLFSYTNLYVGRLF